MDESNQAGDFVGHSDHESRLRIGDPEPLNPREVQERITVVLPPAVVMVLGPHQVDSRLAEMLMQVQ